MRNSLFGVICICLSSFFSAKAQTALKINDNAPDLHILKWVKGKPVTSFEKGKVYVVEFTFVTCKPCRELIPHLSETSRKYRKDGKVEVISIFTNESNPEKPNDLSFVKPIQNLVDYMGNKMDYTVAIDVPKQETKKLWGDIIGFPTTFIVNQEGKIAFTGGGPNEMDFALESLVNTGRYDREDYLKTTELQERRRWSAFNNQQQLLKEKGDYTSMLSELDSVLPKAPVERREELLLAKFETYLYMGDSIAADKYLQEVLVTKQEKWESLHELLYQLTISNLHLPFNFDRYLTVADRAFEEVGIPSLQIWILIKKAEIIYAYKHNKEEALGILNSALKIAKKNNFLQQIDACELAIKKLKEDTANADWEKLMKLLEYGGLPHPDSLDKAKKENGYAGYVLSMSNLSRKILASAADFWDKHPMDQRREQAMMIYDEVYKYGLTVWVAPTISKERAAEINALYTKVNEYYKQGQAKGKKIATGPPLFRMFPRDLKAAAEWQDKSKKMMEQALKNHNSIADKEEMEWYLFTNRYGQTGELWSSVPDVNEHPDSDRAEVENDYWNLFAMQYWEGLWGVFNDHIVKYADYPVVAERALDFLGATAGARHSEEAAKIYWHRIIETYGNPNHPLYNKAGIQALCKQATTYADANRVAAGEVPLDLTFTDMNGNEVDLKKLRGKIVLIDFWATWCKPCVASMPHLKQMYDKYKEKGFEVIGVCLDPGLTDKGIMEGNLITVKEVLKKYNANWPQRYNGKAMSDPLVQLFSISALPTVWLLDKEGKIVDRDASGERQEPLIRKYLGLN